MQMSGSARVPAALLTPGWAPPLTDLGGDGQMELLHRVLAPLGEQHPRHGDVTHPPRLEVHVVSIEGELLREIGVALQAAPGQHRCQAQEQQQGHGPAKSTVTKHRRRQRRALQPRTNQRRFPRHAPSRRTNQRRAPWSRQRHPRPRPGLASNSGPAPPSNAPPTIQVPPQ